MTLLNFVSQISTFRLALAYPSYRSFPPPRSRFSIVRSSSLPFPKQKAKYHIELEAAVDVVERACHLCVDVKSSLLSSDGLVVEKNDQTPVTVADFGIQALVSLELGKLFPSIPLVAEEDSAFVRANNLVDSVVDVVIEKTRFQDESWTQDDVMEGIDRGGKVVFAFGTQPATYWVLDPIDGTRGFLRGNEALYVVGLALVVEGEIVLGVMGCPNFQEQENISSRSGTIMVAHIGCGTWTKRLTYMLDSQDKTSNEWKRSFVDSYSLVHGARFCIPESITWDSLPLSALYNATTDADRVGDNEILLLPKCCGSLCKYLMVASGRASVFIQRTRSKKSIKAWDHAVGIICLHEAGGKVTDWEGNRVDLAADQYERRIIFPAGGVLASNGSLHDQIIQIISSKSSIV